MLSFNQLPTNTNNKQKMLPLTNTYPFVFIIATALGVLMHDTQVDHASSVALNPAHYSSFAVADAVSKSSEHVHVERVSVGGGSSSNIAKIQPRDDDRRYIQSKKFALSGGDSLGLWPST